MTNEKLEQLNKEISKIEGCKVFTNSRLGLVYVDCQYNEKEARSAIENLGLVITDESEFSGSNYDSLILCVEEK